MQENGPRTELQSLRVMGHFHPTKICSKVCSSGGDVPPHDGLPCGTRIYHGERFCDDFNERNYRCPGWWVSKFRPISRRFSSWGDL